MTKIDAYSSPAVLSPNSNHQASNYGILNSMKCYAAAKLIINKEKFNDQPVIYKLDSR